MRCRLVVAFAQAVFISGILGRLLVGKSGRGNVYLLPNPPFFHPDTVAAVLRRFLCEQKNSVKHQVYFAICVGLLFEALKHRLPE